MEEEEKVRFDIDEMIDYDNIEEEEIKTAVATTNLDVWVDCPYCDSFINVTEGCKPHLDDNLNASDIEVYCTCDTCNKDFIVTKINY